MTRSLLDRLFGNGGSSGPDLSEPLLYLRLANGIGSLIKERPSPHSLSVKDVALDVTRPAIARNHLRAALARLSASADEEGGA